MKYAIPLVLVGVAMMALNISSHHGVLLAADTVKGADSTSKADHASAPAKKSGQDKSKDKAGEASGPDKGIGPIKEVKLGPINEDMADQGELIFKKKCTTCHQLDSKKVGPPLRDVTKQQTPEFIMNMILNSDEMEKKNPQIKKLVAQLQTYMSGLDLNQDQARSVLEYLRSQDQKGKD